MENIVNNIRTFVKFDPNTVDVSETENEEALFEELYNKIEDYVIQKMTDFNGSIEEQNEHNRILNSCVMGDKIAKQQVKAMIKKFISDSGMVPLKYIPELTNRIYVNKYGLGAIDDLISDPTLNEIWVNGKNHIWVDKGGIKRRLNRKYKSDQDVIRIIRNILQFDQKEVNLQKPRAESRMLDGSRITVAIPPIAKVPYIDIRKFDSFELTTENLINSGTLNEEIVEWIKKAIKGRSNILIIGECGSGKTSLLKWMTQFIDTKLRIGTIETDFELKLDEKFPDRNIICYEEHPEIGITMLDLFTLMLRSSPDIIIVGESRSYETMEMLKAMRRGHPGSMGTAHITYPEACVDDLASMINEDGKTKDPTALRYMIANAIDIVVQINRDENTGIRRITKITEIVDNPVNLSYSFNDIFEFQKDPDDPTIGNFKKVNRISPKYTKKLVQRLPESEIKDM